MEENYNDQAAALKALTSVLGSLSSLDESDKRRVVNSVLAFLNLGPANYQATSSPVRYETANSGNSSNQMSQAFSTDRSQSPKQFMMEKQPKTDVERIACLAYYLTHFRDMPHFKTLDLTKLNTEAAQPKFTNPTRAAANALDYGYLAPSTKGNRQLSAGGEMFVQSLPNREAAKSAMSNLRPRVKKGKSGKKKGQQDEVND